MVTLKQQDESNVLCLEGTVGIDGAAELKALLIEALGAAIPVRVSMDAQTMLDVTAVQLLWAASRAGRAAGVDVSLAGPVPEPVLVALSKVGIHEFPVAVKTS